MARPLFPFVLLGKGHAVTTTGSTLPELEDPQQPALTRQANARDFRPTSMNNRIKDEAAPQPDEAPKDLSATVVAESSPRGSLTFPRPLAGANAPAVKESSPLEDSGVGVPTTTGSDGLLVLEFTPELPTNPTSSSPAS